MLKQVEFAAAAKNDLLAIALFIAADNPLRALTFTDELENACLSLANHPMRYALISSFEETEIRRRPYGNYSIFYKIGESSVQILRILNAAMDYEQVLG